MSASVVVAATRSPIGTAGRSLSGHTADRLAAPVLAATLARSGLAPDEVTDVEQLSCDRYGFEVRLTTEGEQGVAFGRIGFDEMLQAADEARGAMVALTRRARRHEGD